MKKIVVLGATGSIGLQTLSVLRSRPEEFQVVALAAQGNNVQSLGALIKEFAVSRVYLSDKTKIGELSLSFDESVQISCEESFLIETVQDPEVDIVVVGLSGLSGVKPTIAALEAGKRVITANKETLIAAKTLVDKALSRYGGSLISADSEMVAIHQCLGDRNLSEINKVILTASGGPFWNKEIDFNSITPAQALNHPTWNMGAKITVDSATLMNKGFEVLEAMSLFNLPSDKVDVLIHPQSLIHGLVEFNDGNVIAQLGPNDMRIPLQYCLDWPARKKNTSQSFLDFTSLTKLEFSQPDTKRFKCLELAFYAAKLGQSYPALLVAADEIAVENFLNGQISFAEIPEFIEKSLSEHNPVSIESVEDVEVVMNSLKKIKTTV
jgi:1-deoxy-D-xylulose-5-phosphate reductoisomerase